MSRKDRTKPRSVAASGLDDFSTVLQHWTEPVLQVAPPGVGVATARRAREATAKTFANMAGKWVGS